MIEKVSVVSRLLILVAAKFAILNKITRVTAISNLASQTCCFGRKFIVSIDIIDKVVARDILITEVKHQCGIECNTAETGFEVEM